MNDMCLSVCVCVTETDIPTTVATVKEATNASYIGVFAIAMMAIPISLLVVLDLITLNKKKNEIRKRRHRYY